MINVANLIFRVQGFMKELDMILRSGYKYIHNDSIMFNILFVPYCVKGIHTSPIYFKKKTFKLKLKVTIMNNIFVFSPY